MCSFYGLFQKVWKSEKKLILNLHIFWTTEPKDPFIDFTSTQKFSLPFWHFAEKSCKYLPPLKMHLKNAPFFCFTYIFKPSFSSLVLCKYDQIAILQNPCQLHNYALIYILFECEQKGKDLSMEEHDLDCKWFNKWKVILLRLRFCVCHFHNILRRFHLIKCSWLAINTVKD